MTAIGPYSMASLREPDFEPVYIGKTVKCDGILKALKTFTPMYYNHISLANLFRMYDNVTVFVFKNVSFQDDVNFCRNTTCDGCVKPNVLESSRKMIIPSMGSSNIVVEVDNGGHVRVNNHLVDFSIECSDGVIYVMENQI